MGFKQTQCRYFVRIVFLLTLRGLNAETVVGSRLASRTFNLKVGGGSSRRVVSSC